jgi:hypothetical protein
MEDGGITNIKHIIKMGTDARESHSATNYLKLDANMISESICSAC